MNGVLHLIHDRNNFNSINEVKLFEKNIQSLLDQGMIRLVPVKAQISKFRITEYWYQDCESNELYRYCPPDFPAKGIWEKV